MKLKIASVAGFSSVALLISQPASAVVSVTAVTTTNVNTGNTTTRTGITDVNGLNPLTVNYNGIQTQINTLTAGGSTFIPTTSGTVAVRRNTSGTVTFPTSNANQTSAWNAVVSGGATTNHTVSGVYLNTMEGLFASRNINTGTENLFVNTSDASNVSSNVERMDFIFANGFLASTATAFSVFERGRGSGGAGGANGGFKIAAITGLDAFGVPNAFGATVVSVADDSYNNSGLGIGVTPVNYDVFRYATATGPQLDAYNNANIGPQGVAGALIRTTELVTAGTQIFGYAVFGEDVTATGNNLVNFNNNTFFPNNSGFANDVDLVATGAVVYSLAVPEVSSVWVLGTVFSSLFLLTRRRPVAIVG
ncbi:MAG: hypothetical protein HC845_11455 [Akkermansiaceae bacterium]|nr:hypothetical protein [Akkermansiaceae bacterium]